MSLLARVGRCFDRPWLTTVTSGDRPVPAEVATRLQPLAGDGCRPNERKHGISFEEAITAFDDLYALVAPDLRHSTAAEERRWLIGEADTGVLVVVFTVREEGGVYRIISARPASRKERRGYEQGKRVPL